VPDRTLDVIRSIAGMALIIVGVGGIMLLIRRRPPMAAA
jgi:hypothetical protein